MSLGVPVPTYSTAHAQLAQMVTSAFPDRPLVRKALVGTALLAALGDYVVTRQYAKRVDAHQQELEIQNKVIELYRQKADELAKTANGPHAGGVSVNVVNVNQVSAKPSRYLMEEGAPLESDCFSCSSAHIAAIEASLDRARKAAETEGGCGPECSKWLTLATQESSALFARDWPDDRIQRFPPEQQEVIRKLKPKLERIQRDLLAGDEQRVALINAAAMLKESVRFAQAGDDVDHPEVEVRRQLAEADLAAAERLSVGTFDPDTAQKLRRLRQTVGSGIATPDDLVKAASLADDLARQSAADSFSRLDSAKLDELSQSASSLRQEFIADRKRLAPQNAYAAMRPITHETMQTERAKIRRATIEAFGLPTDNEIKEITDPVNIGRMSENLKARLSERGVRFVTRNLAATEEGSLEAFYYRDPATGQDTIVESTGVAATINTPYGFQVRTHEGAHALLHNPDCWLPEMGSLGNAREERDAELTTIATMVNLGVPMETWEGDLVPPGALELDWQKLQRFDPTTARNVEWASDWLTRAARGEDADLVTQKCPALRKPA